MSIKNRVKKLTEQAKRANKAYIFVSPRYHTTDRKDPLYGCLKPSYDKPFTHDYFCDDELTASKVRELLQLNANDQIVIVDKTFTDNCMGTE
ncbi:MAG: hypothetical protein GY905_15970 [Gammaproteobacteria bacterium]|nr:hypothetical protein [Gammaproteobacteria bacterium]